MEILTIIAIVAGPILAIQAQKYLERKREEKERRLKVFKTLMVTRAAGLSPMHVEALNSIDIEFNSNSKDDKDIRDAWKAYLDELVHYPKDGQVDDKKRWGDKIEQLLIDLLSVMSNAVGYDFDKTYIKRTAYTPIKYQDVESEQDFIRRSLVNLFLGKSSIPITINTIPGSEMS